MAILKGTIRLNMVGPLMEGKPRLDWGHPNLAKSEPILTSHDRAMPAPCARQRPLIAETVGL